MKIWIALCLTVGCGLIAGSFHSLFGVSPMLGAVLCAACFLAPRTLWLVGLGGMLLRDGWVGWDGFTLVRLAGMAAVVALVIRMKIRPTLRSLLAGLFVCAPVFQLTLAVGDWWTGTCGLFPKTAQGLLQSLVSSLPYFQRVLVSDLFFTGLFLVLYLGAVHLWIGSARFFHRRQSWYMP